MSRQVIRNLGAQGGALACVSIASLLVARVGGPTVLGYYALLRVLPWLFGVMISCGLPTAAAYFMAGEHGKDRRIRPTLVVMAVVGAGLSALAWLACAVPFQHVFFQQMPLGLMLAMTISVVTSLLECHGQGLLPGQRGHRRRQPADRRRGVLVRPDLPRPFGSSPDRAARA